MCFENERKEIPSKNRPHLHYPKGTKIPHNHHNATLPIAYFPVLPKFTPIIVGATVYATHAQTPPHASSLHRAPPFPPSAYRHAIPN
jgi:hypothetical protein